MEEHKIVPQVQGNSLQFACSTDVQAHVGPLADESSIAYLRPETAQLIFVDFKQVQTLLEKPAFWVRKSGKRFEEISEELYFPPARV